MSDDSGNIDGGADAKGIYSEEELTMKLLDMLPGVAKYLSSVENVHAERILDMLLLMQRGSFPSDNICFQLFSDVIAWFQSSDVRGYRYSGPVRKFWAVGYRLFRNKFLEFMRGPALKECHNLSQNASYEGVQAKINFAVPEVRHLKLNTSIPEMLALGLLTDMIDSYIKLRPDYMHKSFNLSADMKKINASKRGQYGEVDLAGFENKPTKQDREEELKARLQTVDTCISLIENAHSRMIRDLVHLPSEIKTQLYDLIIDIIKIQSEEVSSVRNFAKSKSYHLEKLL